MKHSVLIYAASVVVGAVIAFAVLHFARSGVPSDANGGAGDSGILVNARGAEDPKEARIRHLLIGDSPAMDERVAFRVAVDQLFGERRSPLRTRAFLKSRIQLMSRDQLILAMMDGQIDTLSELREAARRLTLEDPEGTFSLFEKQQQLSFRTMDRLYAFLDAHLQTWGDRDAPALLARLKRMERGGSQQDSSLRFTDYLARTNPAVAARHFTDIIHLRNMDDFSKMVLNDGAYARKIAESWMRSDEPGMRAYVTGLSAGREREAFEKAMADALAARK